MEHEQLVKHLYIKRNKKKLTEIGEIVKRYESKNRIRVGKV